LVLRIEFGVDGSLDSGGDIATTLADIGAYRESVDNGLGSVLQLLETARPVLAENYAGRVDAAVIAADWKWGRGDRKTRSRDPKLTLES